MQDTFVTDSLCHAVHQLVMVYSIEELGQVQVDGYGITIFDELHDLRYCLMSAASRPKSIAVVGKVWIKDGIEYLGYCLLDYAIHDGGYTQRTFSPVRFGYLHPPDW